MQQTVPEDALLDKELLLHCSNQADTFGAIEILWILQIIYAQSSTTRNSQQMRQHLLIRLLHQTHKTGLNSGVSDTIAR